MLEKFLKMSGVTDKQLLRQLNNKIDYTDLTVHELRDVIEIWNLVPEAQWHMYSVMELEDQREQLLLKEALKRLRNKYREIRNHGKKARNKGDQKSAE